MKKLWTSYREAARENFKRDPTTYIAARASALTGTIALIITIVKLYQ